MFPKIVTYPMFASQVCGPLWKNKKWPSVYLANGVCYVLDQSLKSSQKLLPLVRRSMPCLCFVHVPYHFDSTPVSLEWARIS